MIDQNDIRKYLSMIEKLKIRKNDHKLDQSFKRENPIVVGNYFIDPSCDIRGIKKMRLGNKVVIQRECWLNVAFDNKASEFMIEIGEGSDIGRRCTISAANRIIIGKNVLLAPNVFIADTNHEYRHTDIPIMHQGITTHEDQVIIGDETWIGINSVIMGNVTIGKHCVIGANAVVNEDIPDYCVAVGNPCMIVKIFDFETQSWKKVRDGQELRQIIAKRSILESTKVIRSE